MAESLSFLLGAGFSASMGYPIGNTLNNLLLKCTGDEFAFHTSGVLAVSDSRRKPDFGDKSSYDLSFDFCIELIHYFNLKKGYFDYEEFFDFIIEGALQDPEVGKIAVPYLKQFGNIKQLVFSLKNIYNQLVSYYIKDQDNKRWYDDEPYHTGPYFPGYTGFLNLFQELGENLEFIDVHTLNHDLLFERFNNTKWINGELSDGFEELGSPYYGELLKDRKIYNCRLEYYTGRYNTKFRLYKLHGSFDYGVYYKSNGSYQTPETYIKTRSGIGFSEFKKEVLDEKGQFSYEVCFINYHADFLTGTTSKIERYKEPLLFKILFQRFRENLINANKLIIVGYGGRDTEVNKMLFENFNYKDKPSYIIDPYPGAMVKDLRDRLGATLIQKKLDEIVIDDFK
jgi:hypothetical protein